jgi:pimeloyl-ACP methyl ester carboxylesterase
VAAKHGSIIGSRVEIGYERRGDPAGWPVVLLHGFPYDPRCFDEVADLIAGDGADVIVPYLRGYNVRDIAVMATTPEPPADEARNWYQWPSLGSARLRPGQAPPGVAGSIGALLML